MFTLTAFAWAAGLALAGTIIGSFTAALVIRWPQGRSVAIGRSACDSCGRTLGASELVPLFSALWQRGRCRACGAPIDPRHWQIELAAAMIGGVGGLALGGPAAILGAAFGWLLLPLAALDVAELWLPDRLTVALAMGAVLPAIWGAPPDLEARIFGAFGGYLSLAAIAALYRVVRRREGLGAGDPKLFGAIGLWLGWRALPIVLLLACLIGLAAVTMRALGGRALRGDERVPLGALLAIAAYPAGLVVLASSA